MKKILKPKEEEEAVYYSDFTGKCFGEFHPEVTLKLEFNYGSKFDGSHFTLDLSDKEAESMLELIKSNLSQDYKLSLKKNLATRITHLNEAIDARDYTQSDYYSTSVDLLQFLLR